jgi:hypothetical protein
LGNLSKLDLSFIRKFSELKVTPSETYYQMIEEHSLFLTVKNLGSEMRFMNPNFT